MPSARSCVTGTPGFLTGGFDLTVMQGDDPAAMIRLVSDGGALFTRLFASSVPVVVAAPGHAVAAGALLLLAADERIGTEGSFKVGLIETQIGMFLPAVGDRARRGASESSSLPGRDRRRADVRTRGRA